MFVDFKATFDSVERKVRKERKVVRAIRDRRVRERLVKSCEEMLRETKGRVRVGEKEEAEIWMERGIRQGCLLSLVCLCFCWQT